MIPTIDIIYGNKIIAEFMCLKNKDGSFYINEDGCYPNGTLHFIDLPINYHLPSHGFESHKWNSSWDWLMRVIEKIENMTIDNIYVNIFLGVHTCVISPHVFPEQLFVEYGDTKIEGAWKCIVKFILWYNDNKNTLKP